VALSLGTKLFRPVESRDLHPQFNPHIASQPPDCIHRRLEMVGHILVAGVLADLRSRPIDNEIDE
jgi:hypothetical protein